MPWYNFPHRLTRFFIGPVQTPNFSWAEPNSNWGQPKLFRPAELFQTPILTPAELNSKGEECSFRSNCLQKNGIGIFVLRSIGRWKVRRLNHQSRFKVAPKSKFPAELGGKNGWAGPIDLLTYCRAVVSSVNSESSPGSLFLSHSKIIIPVLGINKKSRNKYPKEL